MSEISQATQNAAQAAAPKGVPPAEGNPALRMLGLPRLRAKLPSRNWSIFLTVVGSFSAAFIYDRRQRRKVEQHWCNAVSHLSREHLGPDQMPRKLTVFLAAPPGDGLRPSREFFIEYIKPVLVAAAVDWDVVEGRREGDVRAALADKIRKERIKNGEQHAATSENEDEDLIGEIRARHNIDQADKRGGDLVIGRHTWKEYIRGLHEGWLGPVDAPKEPEDESQAAFLPDAFKSDHIDGSSTTSSSGEGNTTSGLAENGTQETILDDVNASSSQLDSASTFKEETSASVSGEPENKTEEASKETKSKKSNQPTPPYILPASYSTAELAQSTPPTFNASAAIGQPHLLGFFNTPIRIYRFLTRRRLADATGQQVAALLLSEDFRTYNTPLTDTSSFINDVPSTEISNAERNETAETMWEPRSLFVTEETDWHKSSREPNKEGEENKERPWKEPMALDARILERMRTPMSGPARFFDVKPTAEQREEGVDEQRQLAAGNYREWKGGADPVLRTISWGEWFMEAAGLDERREPRGLGAKDGLVGEDV